MAAIPTVTSGSDADATLGCTPRPACAHACAPALARCQADAMHVVAPSVKFLRPRDSGPRPARCRATAKDPINTHDAPY